MALEKITEQQMDAQGVCAAPDILNGSPAANKAIFDRMVRQLVAPAFNACVEAVNGLEETETGIKQAEENRVANEEARAAAEAERAAAEAAREAEETGYVARAENAAISAESWAAGGTETREGEDTNNARYWAGRAETAAKSAEQSDAGTLAKTKQDKLVGTQGQIVGFDAEGNAVAQDFDGTGAKVLVVTFERAIDRLEQYYWVTRQMVSEIYEATQAEDTVVLARYEGRTGALVAMNEDYQAVFWVWKDDMTVDVFTVDRMEGADMDGTTFEAASVTYEQRTVGGSSGGAKVFEATIGTEWTEDSETGVKSQFVALSNDNGDTVTADDTAKVDHRYNGDGTSEGYATFVEEENQYLTYVTNGYAETVEGGITFYIFGDAPTVSIPVVVEVV